MAGEKRWVAAAWRGHKAISESERQNPPSRLVRIDVYGPVMRYEQRAQIIDAMDVVGMLVGIEHTVERIDVGVEELFAQVRRGIDQHAGLGAVRSRAIDQNRATSAPVLGVAGVTSPPPRSGPRNASGKAAAQNRDRKRHAAAAEICGTLLNRRKKFS